MTNEEAAIKIAEELAVKEANNISVANEFAVINRFLDYCEANDDYDSDIVRELRKTAQKYTGIYF